MRLNNLLLGPQAGDTGLPTCVRTSYDKLRADGAFLLENGITMFLWVGSSTPSQWLTDVFGVAAVHQVKGEKGSCGIEELLKIHLFDDFRYKLYIKQIKKASKSSNCPYPTLVTPSRFTPHPLIPPPPPSWTPCYRSCLCWTTTRRASSEASWTPSGHTAGGTSG